MLQSSAIAVRFSKAAPPESSFEPTSAVETIRAILSAPDHELDYARAKLIFDRIIDPSVEVESVLDVLDRMTKEVRRLAAGASSEARLAAVRRFLHEPGPWNGHRPFAYDQSDPLGRHMLNKLLHNYIEKRLGQCVSMPALFLILAERLGLEVAFGLAPEHVFVRVKMSGRTMNIETTSGAHPARDAWYRQRFPITDRSIEAGVYLRSLSKREGIAVLACSVVEHLSEQARFNEVVAVCKVILANHPRDVNTMVWLGSAYGKLLDRFRQKYPTPWSAPPELRAQASTLMQQNMKWFEAAEGLGWVTFDEEGQNVG